MHRHFGDTSMARKVDFVWVFSGDLSSEMNQARYPVDLNRTAVWLSEIAVTLLCCVSMWLCLTMTRQLLQLQTI